MSQTQSKPKTGGSFAPVLHQTTRTDTEFDLENLSEEERDVLEAEEFIVFGRANIEQWNDPAPGEEHIRIEMDALEASLEQLFALDNISFGHKDVRVGEPLESYTLDEATSVHLDSDETLSFDAGDELRTQVIREGEPLPDGSGAAGEDSLWLVANLFGRSDPRGSRLSQQARLGAYYGELDGFSVTVDKLEVTPRRKGLDVHDVDFLAVTIGTDEQIKNPGSTFGVAAFQALFGQSSDPLTAARGERRSRSFAEHTTQQLMSGLLSNLFGQAKDGLATEAIRVAHDEDIAFEAAAEQVAPDDADVASITNQAEEKIKSYGDRLSEEAEDREQLAVDMADELGLEKEEAMGLIERVEEAMDDDPDEPDGGDADTDDDDDGDDIEEMAFEADFGDLSTEQEEKIAEVLGPHFDELFGDVLDAFEDAENADAFADALQGLFDQHLSDAAADVDAEVAVEEQGDYTDDDEDDDTEEQAEGVTEEQLNARIEEVEESVNETVEEQLGDLQDNLSEQMGEFLDQNLETGSTPDADGSNVSSETDLRAQAEQWASGADGSGSEADD